MRRILLLLSVVVTLGSVHAQVGLTSLVNFNNYRASEEITAIDGSDSQVGGELALNYWFRLPKRRIEFQPTVYYASGSGSDAANEFGFQFKTNLYLFDLGTDCDCPTFGKQGPQLQKGFFLQLSPGVASHRVAPSFGRGTSFSLGAGLGMDFGLSNLVTLTPMASVRYLTGNVWDIEFTDDQNNPVPNSELHLLTYQVGLQATFRFDEKRY